MRSIGYGRGYQYAHDFEEHVTNMQCLPDNLRDRRYYHPTDEGLEKRLGERMRGIEERRRKSKE
jgi:putative ATPase